MNLNIEQVAPGNEDDRVCQTTSTWMGSQDSPSCPPSRPFLLLHFPFAFRVSASTIRPFISPTQRLARQTLGTLD